MNHGTPKLYAARYLDNEDSQWWALPQFLNFYHLPLAKFVHLEVVTQHPAVLYRLLHGWAATRGTTTGKKLQQAGRHFWHHLSWQQRHQPLSRELGQRMAFAFDCGPAELTKLATNRNDLFDEFYQDGDQVKAYKQGGFSYNDDAGEGELEYWTTLKCGQCGHEQHVREQLGGDTPAVFLAANAVDLGGFTYLSGPYCRCDQCDAVSRVKVYPAEDLPAEAYDDLAAEHEWDDYKERLDELITDLTAHLTAQGLPAPDGLRLDIGHADWRGRDAWAECGLEGEALAEKMRIDGQYTISGGELRCYPNGRAELICRMYHHDVPQGSPITVQPYWECELSDHNDCREDHLDYDAVKLSVEGLARIATVLLTGEHRVFEFSKGYEFRVIARHNLSGAIDWLAEQCELKGDPDLEGYDLAVSLLLQRLSSDVLNPHIHLASLKPDALRAVLDHWLDQD